MDRLIGVESAHNFGDCCFNIPLIKALSEHYNSKVGVAVRQHCADAFNHVPWIKEIVIIPNLWDGMTKLKSMGYENVHQITQNIKFSECVERDPSHSLIDTPLCVGKQLGLKEFDQKPGLYFSESELKTSAEYGARLNGRKTIAVERVFTSGQSWMDDIATNMILEKYSSSYQILWVSNVAGPNHRNVDNLSKYTRREIILMLQYCESFYTTGSGFFCASLGLPENKQPKRIVCLWKDEYYRYQSRLAQLKLHNHIDWAHNHEELQQSLNSGIN